MRCLFKRRLSNSHTAYLSFQNSHLSTISKQKPQNSKKNEKPNTENPKETQKFRPLFNEIVAILGTQNTIHDENPIGFSICEEKRLKKLEISHSFEAICENAEEGMEQESGDLLTFEDTQKANYVEIDVSPIVHKVTEIVRGENSILSMEERLEKAGVECNVEVVENVLKRCFKVPRLALRFFNWVRLKRGFRHTTGTYNTMIYIAGEAKEFGVVESLVEEMEKNCCEKDAKTWTILMLHYGKAKLIGKALLTFEKMRECGIEPDVVVYRLMLRSLCNAGKADIASEFYKEMVQRDMEIDLNLHKQLLNCLARSGDVAGVIAVGDDMIKLSVVPEIQVYCFMLKSFCVAGRVNEALELIRELKNKNVSIGAEYLEILIKGLCRADRIADALEIVDILKKRNDIDCKIYGIIIDGYLRRNDICKAFDLFREMKESGHSPTLSTYTNLMQHLFRRNEFRKALELYNEMMDVGVELDCIAMTAVVAGYVHQNRVTEAWNVFKSMEEKGIKATRKSYTIFIKELCKASATNDIFKVLGEMQACKVTIGDDIFQYVTSYLEKKGEMENLEKLKQIQRTCKLEIQNHEASTLEISGQPQPNEELKSRETEQESLDDYMLQSTSRTYNEHDMHEICRILSSSMGWDLVQEKLEKFTIRYTPDLVVGILQNSSLHNGVALRFFSWVGKQNGYNHTTESYNMAIKISGQGKDFKKMRSLFYEMRRRGCSVTSDTWTIMIQQYGRTGLTNLALNYFREMKASGCKPTKSTYKSLIISLCEKKGRKVDEAIQTFHQMIQAGCVPDKELIEIFLGCLSEAGRLSDAKNCIDSLRRIGFTAPLTCSFYIRALCRAGRLEEAFTLLDEVGPERQIVDQYTYGSMVHGLLRRGQLEEALAKVDSMKQIGITPTVHVYTSLMVHFFKEKQIDKALEMFQEMKDASLQPSIVTYSAIIRGYINAGKVDDAWNVYHHLKQNGPNPDFKTYSMFISCLCRIGKSEDALHLISDMSESGIVPSTVNFRNVFFGLNREGKQKLAQTVLQKKWELKNRRKSLA